MVQGLFGSVFIFSGLFLLQSALAIPEADAIRKLDVIPVFALTDDKGVPLPIPREKNLVLPLYLESSKAYQQLDELRKRNPALKVQVVAVPLNVMNTKVAELNKQLKDKTKPLVAPVVVNDIDRQQAVALLKAQGLTEQQINEGLSIPVFFTKPFLSIKTPDGPRGVFYLSYQELQNSLAKLSPVERGNLKPHVADLTAVLREIIKNPQDSYVIFPTLEYFRMAQDNKLKQGASAVATLNAPVLPVDQETSRPQIDNTSHVNSEAGTEEFVAKLLQGITVRIEGPGPSGTGTILGTRGKTCDILTAWHVVSGVAKGESLRVIFSNGKHLDVDASVIKRIRATDMALLSISVPFDIGLNQPVKSGIAKIGEKVFVSGWSHATLDNPLLFRLLSGAIISVASEKAIDGYSIVYTTSSPTLEGMSGGPVVNSAGVLLGIHGRAERLPIIRVEGVKDVATANAQAMPISLLSDENSP